MIAQSVSCFSSTLESRRARVRRCVQTANTFSSRLRFVDHPSFDDPTARSAILAPLVESAAEEISPRLRLAPLPNGQAKAPILSREQEAHLFRKMNYLKCRAVRLSEQVNQERPSPVLLAEVERLQSEAQAVKNQIIEMNLPLVIFVVKKRVPAGQDLGEFISDGNLALIQAVDRFDFARGNRFSTYATWAIRNALASKAESDRRHRGRPFARYEASLTAADPGVAEFEKEADQDQRRSTVRRWFARLGNRERWILTNRYGLGYSRADSGTDRPRAGDQQAARQPDRRTSREQAAKHRSAQTLEALEI